MKNKCCLWFLCLFLFFLEDLSATNFTWRKKSGFWILKFQDQILYNESQKNVIIPQNLNQVDKIEFILNISEFFILKKNFEDYNKLNAIIAKESNLEFLNLLLKYYKNQNFREIEADIEIIIKKEQSTYLKNLFRVFINNRKQRSKITQLECSTKLPYYSLCYMLRLEFYLSKFSFKNKNNLSNYYNLIRMTGIFTENNKLESLPFLNYILPNTPQKLATLGLIKSSIYFQKIIVLKKNIESGIDNYTYEMLSYFYLLDNNLFYAKKVIVYLLKYQINLRPLQKNKFYLKLGLMATLEKKYEESLEYYSKIRFNHWSSTIYHPLTGEPLSINLARDLISYSVWKAKGKYRALNLLKKTSFPDSMTEDDILIKLRALQILNSKPKLSQEFAEKVSYYSQGKKWKRAEYYSTMMNGYYYLKLNKARKANIEFTKIRSILNENDKVALSDLDRYIGLFLSKKKINPKNKSLIYMAQRIQNQLYNTKKNDVLSELKKYSPIDFNKDKIQKEIRDYLSEKSNSLNLLINFVRNDFLDRIYEEKFLKYHISNLILANYKITVFKYFSPDYSFLNQYEQIRIKQTNQLFSLLEPYKSFNLWKNHKYPFIAIFQTENNIYLFSKDRTKILKHKKIVTTELQSSKIEKNLTNIINSFSNSQKIQIFFNPSSMEIIDYLQDNFKKIHFSYFYKFQTEKNDVPKYTPITANCDGDFDKTDFQKVGVEYLEGKKIPAFKNRFIIWNLTSKEVKNIDSLNWKCNKNQNFYFSNLQKRIDFRNKPTALLFGKDSFDNYKFNKTNKTMQSWIYFWLWSQTKSIFYIPESNKNLIKPSKMILSNQKVQNVKKINFYME